MVEFIQGRRELISFSNYETTYGTNTAPAIAFGRNAVVNDDNDNPNWIPIKAAGLNTIDIQDRELGGKSAGFSLSYNPQDWRFLKYVLLGANTDVTDTNSGSYYTHTFTNTVGSLLSFTLERKRQKSTVNHTLRYVGCQVQDFSLEWDATDLNSFVNANATVIAKNKVNQVTPSSLTPTSTLGYKPRYVQLTLEDKIQKYAQNGTFNITNKLDDGRYADYDNDLYKSESGIEERLFKLTTTIKVSDHTYFDMVDGGVKLTGTNSLEFKRGTNDNLLITFGDAYMNFAKEPTNHDGANIVNVDIDINTATFVAKDTLSNYITFS